MTCGCPRIQSQLDERARGSQLPTHQAHYRKKKFYGRRHVRRERPTRAQGLNRKHVRHRGEPRLDRVVRKQRVRKEVLDLRETALALVVVVPNQRQHDDDVLQCHQLEQRRHVCGHNLMMTIPDTNTGYVETCPSNHGRLFTGSRW